MFFTLFIILLPPILALAYSVLEHTGCVDQWTGRKHAVAALIRLKTVSGFPESFLYNDERDRQLFTAIESRISKHVPVVKTRGSEQRSAKPSGIAVIGRPIQILGVEDSWPQECRFAYLPEHSVIYLFDAMRNGNINPGQALRVCTLGDIDKWLSEEKDARKYWVGTFALSLISVAFILLR